MAGEICKIFRVLRVFGTTELFLGVRGFDSGSKQVCAVNRLRSEVAQDAALRDLLQTDAQKSALFDHPNLVRTHGAQLIDGALALILDHVHGTDLATVMQRCAENQVAIPAPAALFIIAEVARGLAYLHARTDQFTGRLFAAPPNVVISFAGDVKLADYELRQPLSSRRWTLAEDAPRIASADVFGLGALLFELLIGRSSFKEMFAQADLAAQRVVQHVAVVAKLAEFDAGLRSILEGWLGIDPGSRPETVEACERTARELLLSRYKTYDPRQLGAFVAAQAPPRSDAVDEYRRMLDVPLWSMTSGAAPSRLLGSDSASVAAPPVLSAPSAPSAMQVAPVQSQPIVVNVSLNTDKVEDFKLHRGQDLALADSVPLAMKDPVQRSKSSQTLASRPESALRQDELVFDAPSIKAARPAARTRTLVLAFVAVVAIGAVLQIVWSKSSQELSAKDPFGIAGLSQTVEPATLKSASILLARYRKCVDRGADNCFVRKPKGVRNIRVVMQQLGELCKKKQFASCVTSGDLALVIGARRQAIDWFNKGEAYAGRVLRTQCVGDPAAAPPECAAATEALHTIESRSAELSFQD